METEREAVKEGGRVCVSSGERDGGRERLCDLVSSSQGMEAARCDI